MGIEFDTPLTIGIEICPIRTDKHASAYEVVLINGELILCGSLGKGWERAVESYGHGKLGHFPHLDITGDDFGK